MPKKDNYYVPFTYPESISWGMKNHHSQDTWLPMERGTRKHSMDAELQFHNGKFSETNEGGGYKII